MSDQTCVVLAVGCGSMRRTLFSRQGDKKRTGLSTGSTFLFIPQCTRMYNRFSGDDNAYCMKTFFVTAVPFTFSVTK